MLFVGAITFLVLTGLSSFTSAEKEWPRSKSGRDLADAPLHAKPATLGQFFNADGTYKEEYLQFRPSECDRRGLTGLRPNTLLTWCPTPYLSDMWDWKCIRFEDLCNSKKDCPNGEDEDPTMCFYVKHQKERMESMRDKMDQMLQKSEELIVDHFEGKRFIQLGQNNSGGGLRRPVPTLDRRRK